ncbi:hypothetical protein [Nocardioides sp.]|uniref:hypothetical protein n=1 Tax=Nocardioides sp. TaxID=35761 RepID=UPI0037843FE5
MTTVAQVRPAPGRAAAVPGVRWAAVAALVAALVRVPFLTRPLGPDEGGYLLVASQWSPGRSLYGAYFVDRPPLLVALFGLADQLGGTVALRLLGIAAVVVAVLLAGRLGGTTAAVLCAALLSTPLFDGLEIDGELLAVPLVLGSFLLVLRSVRGRTETDRYLAPFAAGLLAAAAALVKQNIVDGVVVAAVLLLGLVLQRRWRDAGTRAAAFGAGALAATALALGYADRRGTSPRGLWDALVTFRAQAAAVIHASAAGSTPERFHTLLLAGLLAGVPAVVAAALADLRRPLREPTVLTAAVVVLVWEAAGALLGGSYWPHYLIALVPGLVLLVSATGSGRWLRLATGYAVACAGLTLVLALAHPLRMASDNAVADYVRARSGPTDTMAVAFGHPDIVRAAGLQSPYEHLWSLTARVRDPRLQELTGLMTTAHAPRWIVVDGDSLATWGIDATQADAVLAQHYREVTVVGDWHVYEHR